MVNAKTAKKLRLLNFMGTKEAVLERLTTDNGLQFPYRHKQENQKNGICVFCLQPGLLSYNHINPRKFTKQTKAPNAIHESGHSLATPQNSAAWYLAHSECDSKFGLRVSTFFEYCAYVDREKPNILNLDVEEAILEVLLWEGFLEYWAKKLYKNEYVHWDKSLLKSVKDALEEKDYSNFRVVGFFIKELASDPFLGYTEPTLVSHTYKGGFNGIIFHVLLGGIKWYITINKKTASQIIGAKTFGETMGSNEMKKSLYKWANFDK